MNSWQPLMITSSRPETYETEEFEGFPKRSEQLFPFKQTSISNVFIYLVDSGKEALKMARMRLLRLPPPGGSWQAKGFEDFNTPVYQVNKENDQK